ncbi:uncharacterized protein BDZ99DRAFT_142045 [Mytilinidion resinicola]|uniref:Uncharacterized protein n=1 Tax=Mytilinidion resinicola TaxID=574789 RepID=A0A6A6Z7K6_9PEZI|nr:uncharacterized protein BDZ99DRAFT_142045 [Mytilinidion resinicola]KAF2816699.1 hypothetical protein BDZ99DRAFT_142045 [Mytilinidion resinicola]
MSRVLAGAAVRVIWALAPGYWTRGQGSTGASLCHHRGPDVLSAPPFGRLWIAAVVCLGALASRRRRASCWRLPAGRGLDDRGGGTNGAAQRARESLGA